MTSPVAFDIFVIALTDDLDIFEMIHTETMKALTVGINISTYLTQDSYRALKSASKRLESECQIPNLHIQFMIEKMIKSYTVNLYWDTEHVYMLGYADNVNDYHALASVLKINNAQLNDMRRLRKLASQMDEGAYEEIMRLNNALVNSQRMIEKQNVELKKLNAILKDMSIHDSLTGAYNRYHFKARFQTDIFANFGDKVHSLCLIDFNDFKQVNDQFGHDAGDKLLVSFVDIVNAKLDDNGTIYRIGGDEFIILFENMSHTKSEQYMHAIAEKFSAISTIVTLAYGVIEFSEKDVNNEYHLSQLVTQADQRMYLHKNDIKTKK